MHNRYKSWSNPLEYDVKSPKFVEVSRELVDLKQCHLIHDVLNANTALDAFRNRRKPSTLFTSKTSDDYMVPSSLGLNGFHSKSESLVENVNVMPILPSMRASLSVLADLQKVDWYYSKEINKKPTYSSDEFFRKTLNIQEHFSKGSHEDYETLRNETRREMEENARREMLQDYYLKIEESTSRISKILAKLDAPDFDCNEMDEVHWLVHGIGNTNDVSTNYNNMNNTFNNRANHNSSDRISFNTEEEGKMLMNTKRRLKEFPAKLKVEERTQKIESVKRWFDHRVESYRINMRGMDQQYNQMLSKIQENESALEITDSMLVTGDDTYSKALNEFQKLLNQKTLEIREEIKAKIRGNNPNSITNQKVGSHGNGLQIQTDQNGLKPDDTILNMQVELAALQSEMLDVDAQIKFLYTENKRNSDKSTNDVMDLFERKMKDYENETKKLLTKIESQRYELSKISSSIQNSEFEVNLLKSEREEISQIGLSYKQNWRDNESIRLKLSPAVEEIYIKHSTAEKSKELEKAREFHMQLEMHIKAETEQIEAIRYQHQLTQGNAENIRSENIILIEKNKVTEDEMVILQEKLLNPLDSSECTGSKALHEITTQTTTLQERVNILQSEINKIVDKSKGDQEDQKALTEMLQHDFVIAAAETLRLEADLKETKNQHEIELQYDIDSDSSSDGDDSVNNMSHKTKLLPNMETTIANHSKNTIEEKPLNQQQHDSNSSLQRNNSYNHDNPRNTKKADTFTMIKDSLALIRSNDFELNDTEMTNLHRNLLENHQLLLEKSQRLKALEEEVKSMFDNGVPNPKALIEARKIRINIETLAEDKLKLKKQLSFVHQKLKASFETWNALLERQRKVDEEMNSRREKYKKDLSVTEKQASGASKQADGLNHDLDRLLSQLTQEYKRESYRMERFHVLTNQKKQLMKERQDLIDEQVLVASKSPKERVQDENRKIRHLDDEITSRKSRIITLKDELKEAKVKAVRRRIEDIPSRDRKPEWLVEIKQSHVMLRQACTRNLRQLKWWRQRWKGTKNDHANGRLENPQENHLEPQQQSNVVPIGSNTNQTYMNTSYNNNNNNNAMSSSTRSNREHYHNATAHYDVIHLSSSGNSVSPPSEPAIHSQRQYDGRTLSHKQSFYINQLKNSNKKSLRVQNATLNPIDIQPYTVASPNTINRNIGINSNSNNNNGFVINRIAFSTMQKDNNNIIINNNNNHTIHNNEVLIQSNNRNNHNIVPTISPPSSGKLQGVENSVRRHNTSYNTRSYKLQHENQKHGTAGVDTSSITLQETSRSRKIPESNNNDNKSSGDSVLSSVKMNNEIGFKNHNLTKDAKELLKRYHEVRSNNNTSTNSKKQLLHIPGTNTNARSRVPSTLIVNQNIKSKETIRLNKRNKNYFRNKYDTSPRQPKAAVVSLDFNDSRHTSDTRRSPRHRGRQIVNHSNNKIREIVSANTNKNLIRDLSKFNQMSTQLSSSNKTSSTTTTPGSRNRSNLSHTPNRSQVSQNHLQSKSNVMDNQVILSGGFKNALSVGHNKNNKKGATAIKAPMKTDLLRADSNQKSFAPSNSTSTNNSSRRKSTFNSIHKPQEHVSNRRPVEGDCFNGMQTTSRTTSSKRKAARKTANVVPRVTTRGLLIIHS